MNPGVMQRKALQAFAYFMKTDYSLPEIVKNILLYPDGYGVKRVRRRSFAMRSSRVA